MLLLSTLSTLALSSSLGQADDAAKKGEFSVQRFQPAPGPRNFITVEGARTDGAMAWSGGLFVNYSDSPFRLRSCKSLDDCSSPNATQPKDVNVIKSMVTGDLVGSLTPTPRLQLGLRVPISYVSGDGIDTTTGGQAQGGLKGTGIGDPSTRPPGPSASASTSRASTARTATSARPSSVRSSATAWRRASR
jgi:hypothetical protein